MLRKILVACIMSSVVLSFTSSARAGILLDPNVPYLGLEMSENEEIGRMPSVIFGQPDERVQSGWTLCKGYEDSFCTSTPTIFGMVNWDVCKANSELNCIADVWAVDATGNKVKGQFVKSVPNDPRYVLSENPTIMMPASNGHGAVWKIPGIANSAGNENYFVGVQTVIHQRKGSGIPVSKGKFEMGEMLAAILPVKEVTGNYVLNTASDKTTGGLAWGSNGTQYTPEKVPCASTDVGLCESIVDFPTGYRFGLTLRFPEKPLGWFHGRLYQPNLTVSPWKKGSEISIEAEPVKVPTLDFIVPNKDIPDAVRKIVFNGKEMGVKGTQNGGFQIQENLSGPFAMDIMTGFAPSYKDTATKTGTYWSFKTLNGNQDQIARCVDSSGQLAGLVTTNALTYVSGPPTFDKATGSLNYKVASPHFEANGNVAEGSYDLSLKSDVARCIYGFSKAPIHAEVSVVSNEGEKKVATTVVNEKDGWLYLSAKGFSFSSPTIQVTLTQEKEVVLATPTSTPTPITTTAVKPTIKSMTISCVKGKTVKKVTGVNPKCPSGYKKK